MRASGLGWLVGIALVIALALVAETMGIGGVQTVVGLGMGAGVAVLQARVLRDRIAPRTWIAVTTLGLALPFLVADLLASGPWSIPYSLPITTVTGSTLVGVLQARALRARDRKAVTWVLASAIGWSLAAGMVALADTLRLAGALHGVLGLVGYLVAFVGGGVVLGGATASLVRDMTPGPAPTR